MDWSLLGCGQSGHITYAPDEPELRAQLSATTTAGEAWRCLRCASYVPGPADATGPVRDAPRVRRGLQIRSLLILRIFAVERFLRALLFLGLAVLLWQFKHSQHSIEAAFDRERPILRELFSQLGFNIDHSKLVGLIQHALTLSSSSLTLLAIGLAAYAAIEVVECVGLWLARRWGEYFAMVATSLGLPVEIYELSHKVTVTALIFLAVNLALVVYLVVTKRLLGVRGGKHAYDARLRSDSVMEKAIEAAGASASAQPATPPTTAPASPTTAAELSSTAPPGDSVSRATSASLAPPATPAPPAAPAPPVTPATAAQVSSTAPPGTDAAALQSADGHRASSGPSTPSDANASPEPAAPQDAAASQSAAPARGSRS
jgi:uncharacterized membrane protein (DUF2068 family)